MNADPDISILVNTYNRPELLVKTVAALRRQRGVDRWGMEIVVVDDGSPTSPAPALREAGLLESVRLEERPRGGRAAARNAALGVARGQWIVFLGDDIVASPDLIASHMRLLTAEPEAKRMSLGHCRWRVEGISRPLRELGDPHHVEGLQAGERVGFYYFFTSNVALPRRALDEAGPFDEAYTGAPDYRYGWEDTDLGYRLYLAGWELIYNPAAHAEHIHPPMTPTQVIRRQVEIGFGGCRLYARRPTPEVERIAFWPGTREARPGPAWRRRWGCVGAEILERAAVRFPVLEGLLGRVYSRLHFASRCQGVAEGRRAFPDAGI